MRIDCSEIMGETNEELRAREPCRCPNYGKNCDKLKYVKNAERFIESICLSEPSKCYFNLESGI